MNEKIRDIAIIVGGLLGTATILLIVYILLAKAAFLPTVIRSILYPLLLATSRA